MFEMPLIIPLFYYPLCFGGVIILLSALIHPKHEKVWFVVGLILVCIGFLIWVFVPELEVVIWC